MGRSTTWGMGTDPADNWWQNARCRPIAHKRPEIFYPLGLEKGANDTAGIQIAKQFCAPCPVREACLAEALRLGERWGVWGGLTPAERAILRRPGSAMPPPVALPTPEPREPAPPRRTPPERCRRQHLLSGNNLGTYRGHRFCRACHADRQKQRRARRRAAREAVTSR